jgi:hypothetical protein
VTGVAHLASALYLKGKFRAAPLHLLVLAAGAPDLVWAALNLAPNPGRAPLEIARVDRPFLYIGSLDLALEPYSHALLSTLALAALLAGLGYVAFRTRQVALAVLLAVLGHWFLDYLVHDADLLLSPFGELARVGPGIALDPQQPTRGLNAVAPLAGFALQAVVVLGSGLTFLRAFPPVGGRRARAWFWGGLCVLLLLALPVFIKGALTPFTRSTQMFVVAALSEKAIAWLVIAWLAAKVAGPGAMGGPLRGRDDEAARRHAQQLLETLGALCLLLAVLYVVQSSRDARAYPGVGLWSVALAVGYLLLGRGLVRRNPAAAWLAVGLGWLAGPLGRALWEGGSLAGALAVLELALGGLAVYLIRNLLRRDVQL